MKKYKKVVIVGACYLLVFMLLSAAMSILRDGLSALRFEKKDNGRTEAADTDGNDNKKTEQDTSKKQPEQKQEKNVGELAYTVDNNGNATITGIGTYTLSTLVIPDTIGSYEVTAIAAEAFKDNKTLTEVVISDSVKDIGKYAFNGCKKLQRVVLSNSLSLLPQGIFTNCSMLKEIDIPVGVTTIQSNAFQYCTSLSKVSLPASLTTLGTYAFSFCTSLQSLTIPSRVTKLPIGICYGCTALETLTLSKNLTQVGDFAIPGYLEATNLTIYYPLSASEWNNINFGNMTNGGIDVNKIVYNYSGS